MLIQNQNQRETRVRVFANIDSLITFSIDRFSRTRSFESMATQTAKRKPVFVKVDQLKPGTNGHTLTVKVVNSSPVKTVPNRGARSAVIASRPSRIAECLIGDETASIIFTARNEQGTIFCVCFISKLFGLETVLNSKDM